MSDETTERLREVYEKTVEVYGREDHPMLDRQTIKISPNEVRILLDRVDKLKTPSTAGASLETEALDALNNLVENVQFLDVSFFDEEEQAEAEAVLAGAQAVLKKAGRR